nr:hypothetical protein [Tanacetum cinerariifolium]GFA46730.1 hypothetical protein [Tanacetum cinerariifolium]
YDQSTSTDRPIFLNDNEDHPVQNKESPENFSEENVVSKTNQEPPQDSDIHQLIEECSIEVLEEQKQNIEKTMLDLVKICHHKQFLFIHDDVDDLMESALDSKLLSINSINSQRLDKKEQEIKNVEEQPAELRNHAEKSLQNFRVIHKSSISFNTSQISSIHEVAPILSTKEPEHLLSMGECEVTLEDKRECDELICENSSTIDVCDNHSEILFDSNNDDLSSDDERFEDIKYVDASIPDPAIVSVEEENVVQREEEEVEDISQVQDIVLREKLLSITRLISNIESLNDNSTLDQTGSGNTTHANYSLPEYDSFCFEIEPDHERSRLFLSDNSIPPGIENVADDPEGDIRFLVEVLINDSILSHELSDDNFKDNPSISRPPPEPPDVESFFDLKPDVIAEEISDKLNEDKCFDPGREINVSTKIKDDDYFPFMIVIRFFLPYFIFPEVSPLSLSAESEDTIFDPGISD